MNRGSFLLLGALSDTRDLEPTIVNMILTCSINSFV